MSEQQVEQNPYERVQYLELKVQALLERISTQAATYENQDAERRISITYLEQELKALKDEKEANQADKKSAK